MPWVGCLLLEGLYATWEKGQDPALAPHPLLISKGGKVQDCCQQAAAAGVKLGMPLLKARLLCPGVLTRPWREGAYGHLGDDVCREIAELTPNYEPLFPHEVFLELAGNEDPVEKVLDLRRRLVPGLGHRAAFGLAAGRVVARIAAHLARQRPPGVPRRFFPRGDRATGIILIEPGQETTFLTPLPVTFLWPVSFPVRRRLQRLGFSTVGRVKELPLSWLRQEFGDEGELLYRLCRGVDTATLRPPAESAWEYRTLFDQEVTEEEPLAAFLALTARRLARRLLEEGKVCKEVVLVLEFSGGKERKESRAFTLNRQQDLSFLLSVLLQLRRRISLEGPVTGVRVLARGLVPAVPRQGDLLECLFPPARRPEEKKERLLTSLALLRERYPGLKIALGREYYPSRREQMLACWDPLRYRGVKGNG